MPSQLVWIAIKQSYEARCRKIREYPQILSATRAGILGILIRYSAISTGDMWRCAGSDRAEHCHHGVKPSSLNKTLKAFISEIRRRFDATSALGQ